MSANKKGNFFFFSRFKFAKRNTGGKRAMKRNIRPDAISPKRKKREKKKKTATSVEKQREQHSFHQFIFQQDSFPPRNTSTRACDAAKIFSSDLLD